MKLPVPDWKTAWLERRISDRFFQEMGRQEKATLPHLGTTGRWCAQLSADLGGLAQHLLALEDAAPDPGDVRLAGDKALRIAALASHLSCLLNQALDEPDTMGRYPLHGRGNAPARPAAEPEPEPAEVRRETRSASRSGSNGAQRPFIPAVPVASRHATAAKPMPEAEPVAAPQVAEPEEERPALLSSIIGSTQRFTEASPATMRNEVLALHRKGLSRGEIQVITGHPLETIRDILAKR